MLTSLAYRQKKRSDANLFTNNHLSIRPLTSGMFFIWDVSLSMWLYQA